MTTGLQPADEAALGDALCDCDCGCGEASVLRFFASPEGIFNVGDEMSGVVSGVCVHGKVVSEGTFMTRDGPCQELEIRLHLKEEADRNP